MSVPTFGFVLPPSNGSDVPEPESLWALVDRAEASTLEYIWLSDHIVWWHPMYESLSLLAAVAGRTKRIRIGPAVLLAAMRNPTILAKQLSTIARLSKGRLTLGVGVGGEFPPEWDAVGISRKTRASRTDETIEALRGLWGPVPFSMQGRRLKLDSVDLQPKPAAEIPIWVGGRSDAAIRRAARYGNGWMGIWLTPERVAQQISALDDLTEPKSLTKAMYVWTSIGENKQEARASAAALLGAFYNIPFEKLERYAVYGSPEDCTAKFREFADAGVEHFAVAPITIGPDPQFLERLISIV